MARTMAFNLEVDVNSAATRRQVHGHAAVHRVFSASRTTENQRGFPSGGSIQPMSRPHREKTPASHFLKLGCARPIRQIYAQLHRSNSPSYRRAVWMACDSGLVFLPPTREGMKPWTRPGSWHGTRRGATCCSSSQRLVEPEVVRKVPAEVSLLQGSDRERALASIRSHRLQSQFI
jgi:hypothetical protein